MGQSIQKTNQNMNQCSFGAWSIYTGPKNTQNTKSPPYIYGQWDALNQSLFPDDIKKDIDARIKLIEGAVEKFVNASTQPSIYFAIPEFFFRCQQGPYPKVKIGKKDVFDYIKDELAQKLPKVMKANQKLTVLIGTILTSNIQKYDDFLKSQQVKDRLDQINGVIYLFAPCPPKLIKRQAKKQRKSKRSKMEKKSKSRPKSKSKSESELESESEMEQESSQGSGSGEEEGEGDTKKEIYVQWKRKLIQKPTKQKRRSKTQLDASKIQELMKRFRADPLCMVRNRGIYYHFSSKGAIPIVRVYEKQFQSNIDLTMGIYNKKTNKVEHGGMITEWMAGYQNQSVEFGDKQQGKDYETGSRFSDPEKPTHDIGVQICLDHECQRLRRTFGMNTKNGANYDNNPISKQFIVSAGMEIKKIGVAADKESIIFSADGLSEIQKYTPGAPSQFILDGEVYSLCSQNRWQDKRRTPTQVYFSHNQLAITIPTAINDSYDNMKGKINTCPLTYDTKTGRNQITQKFIVDFSYAPVDDTAQLFCCGSGQIARYFQK